MKRASLSSSRNTPAFMPCGTGTPHGASTGGADGGLELPAKLVQQRLGHATIGLTMDTYSHLFDRGDDGMELARRNEP